VKKVWIDTDPGIDDVFAIAMLIAAKEKIEIVGMSTIFGNVDVGQTTRNAKIVMEAASLAHLPLAKGASYPLCVPLDTSPFVHGDNGLGNMPLPVPTMKEANTYAPQAIVDVILENPNEITLLAIGPLTNVALAYLLEPRIAELAKEVVIMGGAVLCPGNITPAAEANFFHDPHAAQIVINAGWKVSLAGLDVCAFGKIPDELLDKISNSKNPLATIIKGATPFFKDFFRTLDIEEHLDFPDAMAAAFLLAPEIFITEELPLFVETEGSCMGQTLAVPRNKWYEDPNDKRKFQADDHIAPVNVMFKADNIKFLNLLEALFA